jgi:hypothetical protein
VLLVAWALAILSLAGPADAGPQATTERQRDAAGQATSAQSRPVGEPRWEVEAYGGLSRADVPPRGIRTVPPPGPPIATSSPIFPSRAVSSWFFGDGVRLWNDVNAEFQVPERIVPLDAVFGPLGVEASGAAFGGRVSRTLAPRLAVEVGVDVMGGRAALSDESVDFLDRTRTSFAAAVAALLSTGPLTDVAVNTLAAAESGSSRDVAVNGALNVRFRPGAPLEPYATVGAGLLATVGDLPSMTIEGRYGFRILGVAPIEETDRVTLRYTRGAGFVVVLGGGLRRRIADGWSVRIDGRVFAGGPQTRLLLDATPTVPRGAPADFIETFTNPAIQFSNDPATGRRSTLSGPPIHDFAVFTNTGPPMRILITAGIVRRF